MNLISLHSVPRSGSSWLLSIFDSHLNTKSLYQPLFSYAFKNVITEDSSHSDFNNFINNIRDTEDDFCCMKSNFHTNNGTIPMIENTKTDITHIVMKHVTHHYLIEKMIEWNVNIKIIGLIRNPLNVIESQMKAKHENLQDWLNGTDKNNNLKEFYFGFNKWFDVDNYFIHLKKKYPKNVYLIHYEDLLDNTKDEVYKLFNFCNLKVDENTLNFIDKSTSIDNTYDYSVFRNKESLINKKCNLNKEIIDYINKLT